VRNDAIDDAEVSGSRVITKGVAIEPDAGVKVRFIKGKISIQDSIGRVVKAGPNLVGHLIPEVMMLNAVVKAILNCRQTL
jgi:hypothetical protein